MAPKNYPRAQALLKKFYEGKCTPEELALLDSWYDGLGDMPEDILPADASHNQQQFLENFRNSLPSARIVWWNRKSGSTEAPALFGADASARSISS